MSVSLSTFQAWLKNDAAMRCVLVEVDVKLSGGSTVTRYLSNTGYVTAAGDTPANTLYLPYVAGGVKFTESLSLDGSFSLSYGDIELRNVNGELDTWLNDYWANRRIKIFIGDKTWIRDDFWQIFDGVTTGIDTRKRETINLKLSDKLQRLNNPVSEAKLGGATANADKLLPLLFGECHNIEPLLGDPTNHEYVIHNGPIESIIEVRDNGVPVAFTPFLSTGRFRLSASPSGQITCSAQGAVPAVNLLQRSQGINFVQWAVNGVTNPAGSGTAPDGSAGAETVFETATTANHLIAQGFTSVATSTYMFTAFVKAAGRSQFVMSNGTGTRSAYFDLAAGTVTQQTNATAYIIPMTNGWFRVAMSFAAVGTSETAQIFLLNTPNGSTVYAGNASLGLMIWGATVELGGLLNSYTAASLDAVQNTYLNSMPGIIRRMVCNFGNTTNRFTMTDIDHSSFETADRALMGQAASTATNQVGIYLNERTNVLDACNRLASSLGYRLVMSRAGLLQLVRLALPQATAGTSVTASDIADRSLFVSAMPPVKASCQIGYCKNWKTQDNVALGVTESHADLFEQEYLTVTVTDSAAASNYNLYVEPTTEETLLLTGADATTEATRRLNVWNVQRKQLKYKGFGHLMLEQLGNPQTITHARFGLSGGVTGQIIGITTDWLSQKAEIEVLI